MPTILTYTTQLQTALLDQYDDAEVRAVVRIAGEEVFGKENVRINAEATSDAVAEWERVCAQLLAGVPLQYALGRAWFIDLTLKVTPDVLIPRPETEELVEMVIRENTVKAPRILDIGTGSGCIALALQKHIPGAQVTGIDISVAAVAIARINADANDVPATFECVDIFDEESVDALPVYDLILSNPPYIHPDESALMHRNVLDHEPHSALFTPADNAFIFYERIADVARTHLRGSLWFEISADKGAQVAEILRQRGFHGVRILRDMQQKERFVTGMISY